MLNIKLTKKEQALQGRMRELQKLCEQTNKTYDLYEYQKLALKAERMWEQIKQEFLGDKLGTQFIIHLERSGVFVIRRAKMTMGVHREFTINKERYLANDKRWEKNVRVLTANI